MTKRLMGVIKKYRAQLLQEEAQAERALQGAHRRVLDAIQPEIDRLLHQIEQAMANGQDLPKSWLVEHHRLQSLERTILKHMDSYGSVTQAQVAQIQHVAINLANTSALAQLEASLPSGTHQSFVQPSPYALQQFLTATRSDSRISTLFASFGPMAVKDAEEQLILALSLGSNPRAIASGLAQALDIPRWRALTIARTEMLNAYRGASLESYRANSDVVEKWRWTASLSAGTCIACLEMDGEVFDLDEEMESHPNCRCVPTSITKSYSTLLGALGIDDTEGLDEGGSDTWETGSEWFARQDEETQQQVLGPSLYRAYQDGYSLSDMVGKRTDPGYGTSIYVKSYAKVTGGQ